MAVPYTFATATSAIPLSQLDSNFATTITLGNTAIQLGNTVTTLNNMTLANVTISSGSTNVTSETINGNLTISGTGNRILGDFSNATVSSRTIFQTSTANSSTGIYALPSGTSTAASWQATNNSDPTNASKILIATNGSTDVQLVSGINGSGTYLPMTFYNGGSERMRLDTSGNLGIGTSSPTTQLDLTRTVTGGAGLSFQAYNPDTGASSASYVLAKQGSVTTGIYSYGNSGSYIGATTNNFAAFVTNNTERMRIDTSGNVGIGVSSPADTASYGGKVLDIKGPTYLRDTSGGSNYFSSGVVGGATYLQANGTSNFIAFSVNNAERARINSSGQFLIATTGSIASGYIFGTTGFLQHCVPSGAVVSMTGFYNGGNLVGEIRTSTTATAYLTSSDYRLKDNIAPMTGALEKVSRLKPVTYSWKSNGEATQGFIAHELQEIVPEAVAGNKDDVDEDGNPKYQGIDTSYLVATLTAAIQELKAELDVCKAEIAALKGAK